jgi:tetraacyldisaccharide 4'-kinase
MNLKRALYPFALLYGFISWLRNLCFDLGLFKSQPIPGKSICVGNIAVGGTGKSPHTSYLIELLEARFPIQVLSRGYGRKTKGFKIVEETSLPEEVGDEPLMLKQKFKEKTQVIVCENRRIGVQKLKELQPDGLILLDDAFQHRWVKAGLNLVLHTYDKPLNKEVMLPVGRLRESAKGVRRADALIITKCPDFHSFDQELVRENYQKYQLPVFFSRYTYLPLKPLTALEVSGFERVILVSAIAQPKNLAEAFEQNIELHYRSFADHHSYSTEEIKEIHQFFDTFADSKTVLVTTAKDWVKIAALLSPQDRKSYPWMLLDFQLEWSDEQAFNQFIKTYVDAN